MTMIFTAIFIGLISSGHPRPQDPSAYFGKYNFGAPLQLGIKGVKGGGGSIAWDPSIPTWFLKGSTESTSTTGEIVVTSPQGFLVTSSELPSTEEAFTNFSPEYSLSLLPRKVPSEGSSISTTEGVMKAVGSGEAGHHVLTSEELESTEIPDHVTVSKPHLPVEGAAASTEGVELKGETLTTQRLPITTEDSTTFTPNEKHPSSSFHSMSTSPLFPIKEVPLEEGNPRNESTPKPVDIPTYIVSKSQQNETSEESTTKEPIVEEPVSSTVVSKLCGASCDPPKLSSPPPPLMIPYYEPKNVTDEFIEKVKKFIEESDSQGESDSHSDNFGEDLPSDQEMMDLLTDRNLGEEEARKILLGAQPVVPVLEVEQSSSQNEQPPSEKEQSDSQKKFDLPVPQTTTENIKETEENKSGSLPVEGKPIQAVGEEKVPDQQDKVDSGRNGSPEEKIITVPSEDPQNILTVLGQDAPLKEEQKNQSVAPNELPIVNQGQDTPMKQEQKNQTLDANELLVKEPVSEEDIAVEEQQKIQAVLTGEEQEKIKPIAMSDSGVEQQKMQIVFGGDDQQKILVVFPGDEQEKIKPLSSQDVAVEQQKIQAVFAGEEQQKIQPMSGVNDGSDSEQEKLNLQNKEPESSKKQISVEKDDKEIPSIASVSADLTDQSRSSREESIQKVVVIPVEQGQIKITSIEHDSKPGRTKYSLIPHESKWESDALTVPPKTGTDDEEGYFSMEQGEIREVSSEEFKTTPPVVRVVTEVSVESMKSSKEKVVESSPQQVENKKSGGPLSKAGKIFSDAWAAVTGLFHR